MFFDTLSSPVTSQQLVSGFFSRKLLLLETHLHHSITASSPMSSIFANQTSPERHGKFNKGFDANAAMVLAVLVCALMCSLGLSSIIKCARRLSRVSSSTALSVSAGAGITEKAQKAYLTIAYLAGPHVDTECVICLTEFATSEIVLILPKCHHGFHVRCIGKWLRSHSSCPTCRHSLIEASEKIIRASSETMLHQPLSPEETIIVIISPLEPEGVILNYRGISSAHLSETMLATT